MTKQQRHRVDQRIKRFMSQKMAEYPELKEQYGPRVEVVQRGYFLEDIISMFKQGSRVS